MILPDLLSLTQAFLGAVLPSADVFWGGAFLFGSVYYAHWLKRRRGKIPPEDAKKPVLLTRAEAAKRVGVSRWTIGRDIEKGHLGDYTIIRNGRKVSAVAEDQLLSLRPAA